MALIQINFTNKWLYTLFVVVLLLCVFSVYAYVSIPNPGHGGDVVWVSIDGEEMSLQEALDRQEIVPDSLTIDYSDLIMYKRSASGTQKGQILWCDDDYPLIVHCSPSDDEASSNIYSTFTQCLTDGECNMAGSRTNLGGDMLYLELVHDANGRWGCLAYDSSHNHQPYKLDIACMKSSEEYSFEE